MSFADFLGLTIIVGLVIIVCVAIDNRKKTDE